MSDKTSKPGQGQDAPAKPAPKDGADAGGMQKVDEKTQKDAAIEREKTGGYE